MTISEERVREILQGGTQEDIIGELGFITTVLRDNELDDDLHKYYQAVLTYLNRTENKA